IICEPTSTIVIDPECRAEVTETGAVLITVPSSSTVPLASKVPVSGRLQSSETQLTAEACRQESERHRKPVDLVRLELFSNRFTSIAEQMGEMLRRTATSTNVRERLDYSCALFDDKGQLVVNAPHVPVHLGAMGETVRAVMTDHPNMMPGDVFVTNDPYRGGSHLPDVTVITPVFINAAQTPCFFTANRAHHAEIGGIRPGSMPPMSSNLAEEGVLIRSRKLVDRGVSCEDQLQQLLLSGQFPSRAVHDNLADLAAQVAANECGVRLLKELVQTTSLQQVADYMAHLQDVTAQKVQQAFLSLGNCKRTFRDELDDGTPICVSITIDGAKAVIDFTDSGDVHPGNLNANRAITTSAVLYTLRCLLAEDVPLNAGVLRPVELIIPHGILNPAEGESPDTTPAVVGGNVETSQRIVNALFGALQLAAASQGTMNNLTFGDTTFGYYETICGGAGATASASGADAVHTHMTNTRLTDPEILEKRYPVRLRRFCIRRGSGGPGRNSGGDGIIRELEFLRRVEISMMCQSFQHPPYGMLGGQPGATGINELQSPGEDSFRVVGGSFHASAESGSVLRIQTPGGGGFGQPALSNPDA
ncbi:MAG: hydantoinase B/oxoprolinase family protein, partial [Planctomycetaceae bacterium]|nr:hydantoinase B/oxoprolinase family protein [Planctomycetaceae bacterium]